MTDAPALILVSDFYLSATLEVTVAGMLFTPSDCRGNRGHCDMA